MSPRFKALQFGERVGLGRTKDMVGRSKVASEPTLIDPEPSSPSQAAAMHATGKSSKGHDFFPNTDSTAHTPSATSSEEKSNEIGHSSKGNGQPPKIANHRRGSLNTHPKNAVDNDSQSTKEQDQYSSSGAADKKKASTANGVVKPKSKSGSKLATAHAPRKGKRSVLMSGSSQDAYAKAFSANPGKISWVGDWFSSAPTPVDTSKIEFVPQMYHGSSDESKPNEAPHPWTTNAEKAVKANQKYFLSFGEPNTNNTADDGKNTYMDAKTAAKTFYNKMNKYAVDDGVKIGSPGTLGAPLDIEWQNDFLDECAGVGCRIGFVGCHWVSPCAGDPSAQKLADTFWGTVNDYKDIAKNHSKQYGVQLKVWVDNFGMACKSETQKEFLDIVVPMLEKDDMIERYVCLV